MMRQTLDAGLPELGLDLPESARQTLCDFGAAVIKQNEVMNLTAITQPDQVAKLHLLDSLTVLTAAPADLTGMVTVATHDATVYMPMSELVDIAKELERIAAERKKAEENLQRIEAKLANESFTSRAPENVVNAEQEKAEKARALIAKLDESAAAMKL